MSSLMLVSLLAKRKWFSLRISWFLIMWTQLVPYVPARTSLPV